MVSRVLNISSSAVDAISAGTDAFKIWSLEKLTRLDKAELVAKVGQIFSSMASVLTDLSALEAFGKRFKISDLTAAVVTEISSVSKCVQSGIHLLNQFKKGQPLLTDAFKFAGNALLACTDFDPNLWYKLANKLTRHAKAASWIGGGLEFVAKIIPHLPDLASSIKSIYQSIWPSQASDEPSAQTGGGESVGISPWVRLKDFMDKNKISPSFIERLIEDKFKREELKKFICPLSHKIILEPLKHKESGALFEKTFIEKELSKGSSFSHSVNGSTYKITKESLVPSPEEQTKIADTIERTMAILHVSFSKLQNIDSIRKSDDEEGAMEQLARKGELVSFNVLKRRISSELEDKFNSINNIISSRRYCVIDPRRYFVNRIKRQIEKAKTDHESEVKRLTNRHDLIEKLQRMEKVPLIPGILRYGLISEIFDRRVYDIISQLPKRLEAKAGLN